MKTLNWPYILVIGFLAVFCVIGCGQDGFYQGASVSMLPASLSGAQRFRSARKTEKLAHRSPSFREVRKASGIDYHWEIPANGRSISCRRSATGAPFWTTTTTAIWTSCWSAEIGALQGDGHGHFTDVTQATGLDKLHGHFLGCAVGDYDNDGYDDIYISGYQTGCCCITREASAFATSRGQPGLSRSPGAPRVVRRSGRRWLSGSLCRQLCAFDPKTDLVLCPYHGVLTVRPQRLRCCQRRALP